MLNFFVTMNAAYKFGNVENSFIAFTNKTLAMRAVNFQTRFDDSSCCATL